MLSAEERRSVELALTGVNLGDHVMAGYRRQLAEQGVLDSRALQDCPPGVKVRVAGLEMVHQAPPTAKGHHFLTLEDEWAMINVIVRPDVYEKHRRVLQEAVLLIVEGTLQRQGEVVNVVAEKLQALR